MSESVRAVDLFCGAGGLSWGLASACEALDRDVDLTAVNHWERAIQTHKANHPWADHYHAKIEEVRPIEAVPERHVDVLVAGPECTHFSTARGGQPVNEQKRASPFHVLDWLEKLDVDNVLLENVPEFEDWGPVIDGQPTRNGEKFDAYVDMLHAEGYSVDWRVLNAADYGDATSRSRFFLIARRNGRPEFPEPSHSESGEVSGTEPWRSAAEIIDWSDPGESIWARDRPLVNNTMQRIAEGIKRHGADLLEPFADAIGALEKEDVAGLQERVVPADHAEIVAETLTDPFLVKYYGTSTARPIGAPVDTVTSGGQKFALCVPYVLGQQSGYVPRAVDEEPVPVVATRGCHSLIEPTPFVLPRNGYHRGLHSNPAYDPAEQPLHTVTAKNHDGHLIRPSLMRFSYGGALLEATDPLPTITTARCGDFAVTQPYLIQYNGQSGSQEIGAPLPTATTRDRFALCLPELYPWGIDVRFRMLKPLELARAQGFPDSYEFAGNKTETVEQIGNAVPVNLAESLCERLLVGDEPTLRSFGDDGPQEVSADD